MKILPACAMAVILFAAASHASVKTEELTYSEGGTTFKGFLAWDDAISGLASLLENVPWPPEDLS